MQKHTSILERMNHALHSRLLSFLLCMYGCAIFFPRLGVVLRELNLATISWFGGEKVSISVPSLMLAFLLFNAGFSVQLKELKKTVFVPVPLVTGLIANVAVPIVFTVSVALLGRCFWHNSDEIQNILVGLAIIASMPIAGSSTVWTQNCRGNLSLILGLVVLSTVLSPLLSPLVFHTVGSITTGDYSEDLHELATQGTSNFLIISVVIPSLMGIIARYWTGEHRAKTVAPFLRSLNLMVLLLLNYSNAATALPQLYLHPDYDFFALVILVAVLLCGISFYMGWIIPKLLKIDRPNRAALMFGLGMNNNGTGLVLASLALKDHPSVMLPIIFYNLGQQIVAGVFNTITLKRMEAS